MEAIQGLRDWEDLMRRLWVALVLVFALIVPAQAAGANDCPAISGRAILHYGTTGAGVAQVTYGGMPMIINFLSTGFTQTGPRTADIDFEWYFPGGTVELVELSTMSPLRPPRFSFSSDVDVTAGGNGSMTWQGISNVFRGIATFTLSGNVCVDV